jgi:hypothetical protein
MRIIHSGGYNKMKAEFILIMIVMVVNIIIL